MDEANYTGHAINDILTERNYQIKKWGGALHDSAHSPEDWVTFLKKHLIMARHTRGATTLFRKQMVRIAALAIAAIESEDKKLNIKQRKNLY